MPIPENSADNNNPARQCVGSDRMRSYAVAALTAEAEALAGLTDGRRDGLLKSSCSLAKFATHGVLLASEISGALMAASKANGAVDKYGLTFVQGTIARGIMMGRHDSLPTPDAGRDPAHSIGQGA
jgi:hypothetical protein